jgi:hypothetical protein
VFPICWVVKDILLTKLAKEGNRNTILNVVFTLVLQDYSHFYRQGRSPSATRTCALWTNVELVHHQELALATKKKHLIKMSSLLLVLQDYSHFYRAGVPLPRGPVHSGPTLSWSTSRRKEDYLQFRLYSCTAGLFKKIKTVYRYRDFGRKYT